MPSPEAAVTNDGSNLKSNLIGSGYGITPAIVPTTDGPTCIGCKPNGWYIKIPSRDATSSLTAYAGNSFKKWVTPLLAPSTGSGSILTVVNDEYTGEGFTTIKNLVKGKKYKITFSVSTTNLTLSIGRPGPYAGKANISIVAEEPYKDIYIAEKEIDFTNKEAQWITESLEFVADRDEYKFRFQGISPKGETRLTYANMHIGPNAIKVIN